MYAWPKPTPMGAKRPQRYGAAYHIYIYAYIEREGERAWYMIKDK
jgi:hypothetical protein